MKKLPKGMVNSFLAEDDYLQLVNQYAEFYFEHKSVTVKSKDIDFVAFVGGRLDDGVTSFPPRTIPYGDTIIEAFRFDKRSYYRTNTGYFIKQYQSIEIVPTTKERFDLARRFLDSKVNLSNTMGEHTAFSKFKTRNSDFPQAGLTRGSKGTLETQKTRLEEIQEKYKDGVK